MVGVVFTAPLLDAVLVRRTNIVRKPVNRVTSGSPFSFKLDSRFHIKILICSHSSRAKVAGMQVKRRGEAPAIRAFLWIEKSTHRWQATSSMTSEILLAIVQPQNTARRRRRRSN